MSNQIAGYMVIEENTIEDLMETVSEALADGFMLQGVLLLIPTLAHTYKQCQQL